MIELLSFDETRKLAQCHLLANLKCYDENRCYILIYLWFEISFCEKQQIHIL